MKIGVDVRCLAEGRRTGVEEYTTRVLGYLFEKDKTNQFILFHNSFRGSRDVLAWTRKYGNVEVRDYRFPNKLLNFLLWFFKWPKLDRLIGGVDIFFSPNLSFLALSGECKKILTVHDLSFERFEETFSLKRRLWHFLVNPRSLCRQADQVIAVSDSTKQDLVELYGLNEGRIKVMAPPLDFSSFKNVQLDDQARQKIKAKYGIGEGFILYLGTIEPRKNIIGLIEAYEALWEEPGESDWPRLVIAGEEGWKSEGIHRKYQQSPLKDKIDFIGYVQDEDKPCVYKMAKVLAYPSFFEGFGFPPLEAMAAGTPVVTSNCSSLPEITDGAALLVDPYRPYEITQGLRELLQDESLRRYFIDQGRKRIDQLEKTSRDNFELF